MSTETHYAKNGDVHIAYQVVGDGPRDILFVPGWTSHLELGWRFPSWAHLLNRLASFSRLIVFDKRGTGLSDPVTTTPTLEERVRDICALMDAVGSERAVLFGECEGAPVSVMFAAAHPERTEALALYGAMPCVSVESEGPRWIDDAGRTFEDAILNWGQGKTVALFAPSLAGSERVRRSMAEFERASASPGMACALLESLRDIDVASAASSVHVPTLVLHRRHDFVPIEPARQLAELIPGARFVELEGEDHALAVGDTESVVGEIEEFVTGARRQPEPARTLLTVLFTDIVGSASWRPSSATRAGGNCSTSTTGLSEACSKIAMGARSRPSAMASSPPSTAPRGRSGARGRSSKRYERSTSSCAPGSTPARSSSSVTTSAAWRSTSARAWQRSPGRASCS